MPKLRIEPIQRGRPVTIRVNGVPVSAFAGETVHAALLAAGYRVLRKSKTHRDPRGFFCGMGICYECLVTIDGMPGRRACMHNVEDGMEIGIDDAQL
jgi:sarcosine oxidase subunit alpha